MGPWCTHRVVRRPPGDRLWPPCPPIHTWSLPSSSAFSAIMAPAPANPQGIPPSATLGPSLCHTKLVLLQHTAEQVSLPQQRRTPPRPATPPGPGPRGHLGDRQLRAVREEHVLALRRAGPTPRRGPSQTGPVGQILFEPLHILARKPHSNPVTQWQHFSQHFLFQALY